MNTSWSCRRHGRADAPASADRAPPACPSRLSLSRGGRPARTATPFGPRCGRTPALDKKSSQTDSKSTQTAPQVVSARITGDRSPCLSHPPDATEGHELERREPHAPCSMETNVVHIVASRVPTNPHRMLPCILPFLTGVSPPLMDLPAQNTRANAPAYTCKLLFRRSGSVRSFGHRL